jgi:hypothetical protein
MVKWIVECFMSLYFVVLINGVGSPFFFPTRGLCQECDLFLLIVDVLIHLIVYANNSHQLQGFLMGRNERLSHLIFVDGVLIFFLAEGSNGGILKEVLTLFSDAMGMEINLIKYVIYFLGIEHK